MGVSPQRSVVPPFSPDSPLQTYFQQDKYVVDVEGLQALLSTVIFT